jgi:hypothetical protein
VLPQGFHIEFSESGVSIVLLQVSGTVLVEIKVLVVTTIMQRLEGQVDVRAHCIDPVPSKEMIVKSAPYLVSILLGCVLLDMLSCT